MPGKGHKSEYAILITLGVISFGVILLLVLFGWLTEDRGDRMWVRSTHSTNVDGTLCCYVLFERLGFTPVRSEAPLLDEALDGLDVLLVIDPIIGVQEGELAALTRWVQGGGVLICTTGRFQSLDELHGMGEGSSPGFEEATEAIDNGSEEIDKDFDDWESELSRDVPDGATRVRKDGGELPLARDVAEVEFEGSGVLQTEGVGTSRGLGPVERLFADDVGLRCAGRRAGAGHVLVLADSSFLANDRIGRKDNAVLAVNLVCYARSRARGGRVGFDEYHFGFGARETGEGVLAGMLFRTAPGWAVLSVTAAGVLYLIYRGRRFGTRRSPSRQRRRSKMEYVQSVGATYRAAGANRLTLELVFRWFRQRCAECVGLNASAPVGDIAARLAQRSGRPPGRYEESLGGCEEALGRERVSAHQMSVLLEKMAGIESEISDGHSGRR